MGNYANCLVFENPRRGGQARNFTKCFENSRSQIVFRTGIFQKLTLGALGLTCLLCGTVFILFIVIVFSGILYHALKYLC